MCVFSLCFLPLARVSCFAMRLFGISLLCCFAIFGPFVQDVVVFCSFRFWLSFFAFSFGISSTNRTVYRARNFVRCHVLYPLLVQNVFMTVVST